MQSELQKKFIFLKDVVPHFTPVNLWLSSTLLFSSDEANENRSIVGCNGRVAS